MQRVWCPTIAVAPEVTRFSMWVLPQPPALCLTPNKMHLKHSRALLTHVSKIEGDDVSILKVVKAGNKIR